MEHFNFDEIRPYHDDEVPGVLMNLTQEPQLLNMLEKVYPEVSLEQIIALLQGISTIEGFQEQVISTFMKKVEIMTTKGIEKRGIDNIDSSKPYLFISNHRDIVLDSAFLNTILFNMHYPLTEIGIGDNLLIYPWIQDVVKLNRSFVVQRGVSAREFLESSKRLSAYIRYTLTEKKQSVWIAQREGRAKNSDDRTQEALLKMLNMSGEGKNPIENLAELSVCPLSISYEYDPCDFLKAKEFQEKRDNPEFKKTAQDDLRSMQTGLNGYKGKVVYYMAGDIRDEITALDKNADSKSQLIEIANLIDKYIHRNYAIFSTNKIAYDLWFKSDRFSKEYSEVEKQEFEDYLQEQIEKIRLDNRDDEYLRGKMLEMYANPLINYMKANGIQ